MLEPKKETTLKQLDEAIIDLTNELGQEQDENKQKFLKAKIKALKDLKEAK